MYVASYKDNSAMIPEDSSDDDMPERTNRRKRTAEPVTKNDPEAIEKANFYFIWPITNLHCSIYYCMLSCIIFRRR